MVPINLIEEKDCSPKIRKIEGWVSEPPPPFLLSTSLFLPFLSLWLIQDRDARYKNQQKDKLNNEQFQKG